jgi:hypothetical protein
MLTSLLRRLTRPAPLDDEMREALQESVRAELDEPFEVKREQLFPELVARTRFEEAVFAYGLAAADSMRFERNPADGSYVNPYVQCAWIGYMMGVGL